MLAIIIISEYYYDVLEYDCKEEYQKDFDFLVGIGREVYSATLLKGKVIIKQKDAKKLKSKIFRDHFKIFPD